MNPHYSPLKILIVDDQREVRRMIKAALESQFPGASLQDVPSAEEAMVLLSQDIFHLLVLDIHLAGMSGLKMIEKTRQRLQTLKIVVVTGLSDPIILQQLEQAPIQAWFRKPIPMEEFLACITNLLSDIEPFSHLPIQTTESAIEGTREEVTFHFLNALSEKLSLTGLWVCDIQGNLLAQSSNLPSSIRVSQAIEYFTQVETEINELQIRFGAEAFSSLAFYLNQDCATSQLHFENFRVIFCVEKGQLPSQPLELQLALVRKGQELLNALRETPSNFTQEFLNERSMVEGKAGTHKGEKVEINVPPDADLEALLQNPSLNVNKREQIDEFWEQGLASDNWTELTDQSQTLHFQQARQLGILPNAENEDPFKE